MIKPLGNSEEKFAHNTTAVIASRTLATFATLCLLALGFSFRATNSVSASPRLQAAQTPAQGQNPANIWESTIQKFEAADKVNPPRPGMIVFAGSSSFARWSSLVDDMKPLDVLNRGFGGSKMSDLDYYAKRIVNVYRPEAVVVYEGDNDLAATSSATPKMVAAGFQQFVQIVRADSPDAWIYFISIKPSKLRWKEWPKMRAANAMIQHYATTQKRVQYIDIATPMFDAQGNLPADLFVSDGLHPTAKCYALWTSIIKPILLARFPASSLN